MRTRLLMPVVALAMASTAHADVIEISDDGEARILGASITVLATPDLRPEIPGATVAGDPFITAARRHGIDVGLLRAVAWTESRGRNDAVSPKGARGVMQLMPATAAELGVDPRDPVANINGGAAFLARQLATFRDVPLALAAYNAGPGAVLRYRGVPPFAETRDYVQKIMRRWSPAAGLPAAPSVPEPQSNTKPLATAKPQPMMLIEVPEL